MIRIIYNRVHLGYNDLGFFLSVKSGGINRFHEIKQMVNKRKISLYFSNRQSIITRVQLPYFTLRKCSWCLFPLCLCMKVEAKDPQGATGSDLRMSDAFPA